MIMDKKFSIMTREVFYLLTAAVGIFIIMEICWPNLILAYFNLNWLILLWLISALVLFSDKSHV